MNILTFVGIGIAIILGLFVPFVPINLSFQYAYATDCPVTTPAPVIVDTSTSTPQPIPPTYIPQICTNGTAYVAVFSDGNTVAFHEVDKARYDEMSAAGGSASNPDYTIFQSVLDQFTTHEIVI